MPETLGFTNEGLILTSNRSYSFGVKSMRLGLFDPKAGGRVKRTFRVTVPPGQQVTGLWLSPRGYKLCWYMDSLAYQRSALPWIERFLMRTGINSTPRKSLCVSRADGSYMRVIGTVEVGPRLIRWLPDNNQISFVVHDALYTIPVD